MAQINKGTTYSISNATVTIDNLNAHVDGATLLPGAIFDQTALPGSSASLTDQVLLLSGGNLNKATLSQVAPAVNVPTGVTPGTYGSSSSYPVIAVDQYGKATSISTQSLTAITVSGFSAGTTGLTPTVSTQGEVTLGGTLKVANGGTGANTLSGYVKGTGTAALTAIAAIPVADLSGLIPVANGGTGASTLTGYLKGTGTAALTAIATVPVADISGTLPISKGGTAVTAAGARSLVSTGGVNVYSGTDPLQIAYNDSLVIVLESASSTANIVYLPDVSLTVNGSMFFIANQKSVSVAVRIFGGTTTYVSIAAGKIGIFILNGTTNATTSWTNNIG
jgi:hypothetical protein